MEHNGWLLDGRTSWIFLGIWTVVVVVYGIWRSRGDAPQNAIRPSGPPGSEPDA